MSFWRKIKIRVCGWLVVWSCWEFVLFSFLKCSSSIVKLGCRIGFAFWPGLSFGFAVKLNAGRNVIGVLRGFDQFMNLVLDNTVEINGADRNEIGMVVRTLRHGDFCLCDDASAQELLTILLFSECLCYFLFYFPPCMCRYKISSCLATGWAVLYWMTSIRRFSLGGPIRP